MLTEYCPFWSYIVDESGNQKCPLPIAACDGSEKRRFSRFARGFGMGKRGHALPLLTSAI